VTNEDWGGALVISYRESCCGGDDEEAGGDGEERDNDGGRGDSVGDGEEVGGDRKLKILRKVPIKKRLVA